MQAWGGIRGPMGPARMDEYVRMLCIYAHRWPEGTSPDTSMIRFWWEQIHDAAEQEAADKAAGKRRPGPIVPVPVPPQPEMRRAAEPA